MGIQGGVVGSIDRMRALAAGSGGDFIRNVPKEGITVRFLTEPDRWIEYKEYGAQGLYPRPLVEGQTAPAGSNVSRRYAAPAIDISGGEDKVIVIKLAASLAQVIISRWEKSGTLLDRDYELERFGEQKQTRYAMNGLDKVPRKLDKYDVPDVLAIVEAEANRPQKGEDGEAPSVPKRRIGKQPPADLDDAPNDDDDVTDDDDDETTGTEVPWSEVGAAADDDDQSAMDLLTEAAEAHGLDEADYETWEAFGEAIDAAEAAAAGDDAEDDADAEDDDPEDDPENDDVYTEEELTAMTLGQLRVLAKENDIPTAGLSKAAIVAALMDA